MTKAEVFKELLKEYEKAAKALIWDCPGNIPELGKILKKEIAEWAKSYEEGE